MHVIEGLQVTQPMFNEHVFGHPHSLHLHLDDRFLTTLTQPCPSVFTSILCLIPSFHHMNYNQPEFFYAPEISNVFLVTLLTRWVGMVGSSWPSSLVTMFDPLVCHLPEDPTQNYDGLRTQTRPRSVLQSTHAYIICLC